MTLRRRWRRPALLAALILVAAVVPLPARTPSTGALGPDKLLHLLAHAALALTLADALDPGRRGEVRTVALAAALSGAYGLAIELLQAPLATRGAEVADAVAAALGSGLGAIAWRVRRR